MNTANYSVGPARASRVAGRLSGRYSKNLRSPSHSPWHGFVVVALLGHVAWGGCDTQALLTKDVSEERTLLLDVFCLERVAIDFWRRAAEGE
jgi:hypothetical protein